MEIIKESFKKLDHPQVVCIFDVYIKRWGLVLRGLSLIHKKDGGEFVSYHSESYQDKEGKKKFWRSAYFKNNEIGNFDDNFQEAVKNLLKPFLSESNPPQNLSEDPATLF